MFRAVQLYTFLEHCDNSPLDKVVLECGAGINPSLEPLLVRFFERGYTTHGIELSAERVDNAVRFCREHDMALDIRQGDMRELPFDDGSISFVFSYNSVFHMAKRDTERALAEIKRVLKKGGLCFVNFLSVDSASYGQGEEVAKGEFVESGPDWDSLHTYYEDDEPDSYLTDFEMILKEKRIVERFENGQGYVRAYIDYIVTKIS